MACVKCNDDGETCDHCGVPSKFVPQNTGGSRGWMGPRRGYKDPSDGPTELGAVAAELDAVRDIKKEFPGEPIYSEQEIRKLYRRPYVVRNKRRLADL